MTETRIMQHNANGPQHEKIILQAYISHPAYSRGPPSAHQRNSMNTGGPMVANLLYACWALTFLCTNDSSFWFDAINLGWFIEESRVIIFK